MTNPTGNGAASNGATPAAGMMTAAFDPAAVTSFWMSSSARMMRSGEIMVRGMTEVARLEAELGQQYLQHSLSVLQTPVLSARPDQLARTQADHAMQNVEVLLNTMRKMSDQFRQTIEESTQALFDMPATRAPAQSLAASIHITDPVVKRRAASAAELAVTE